MKKLFRKALVLIAIMGMGTGVTSCDSESILKFIEMFTPEILQILMPNNAQPTQTFVGEWEAECLNRTDETTNQWSYYQNSQQAATIKVQNTTCEVSLEQEQNEDGTISNDYSLFLSIPSITLAGNTISNLIIYAGTFISTDLVNGSFDTEDQFYNISMDGMPETAETYYACISNGNIANNEITFDYQIVAGLNAYNGKYVGTLKPTENQ